MIVENREFFSCQLTTSDPSVHLDPDEAVAIIDDDDGESSLIMLPQHSLHDRSPSNSLSPLYIHVLAVTIQPEEDEYIVGEMADLRVPIVISEGSLEPGSQCTVTVHTRDGTAVGESRVFKTKLPHYTVTCAYLVSFQLVQTLLRCGLSLPSQTQSCGSSSRFP